MRFIAMFITTARVLFLIKLRSPKKKSIWDLYLDIKMESGLDKRAKATFRQGKLTTTVNIQINLDFLSFNYSQKDHRNNCSSPYTSSLNKTLALGGVYQYTSIAHH